MKAEDFFIIDSEAHIMPWEFRKNISYYPATAYFSKPAESSTGKWWNTNPLTKERREKPSDWTADALVEAMDQAGIDKACMLRESFLNMSYNGVPCATNYHTIEAIKKYPERIIGCSNVGPHLIRGVKRDRGVEDPPLGIWIQVHQGLFAGRFGRDESSGYVPFL